jgi:hypothetical protein
MPTMSNRKCAFIGNMVPTTRVLADKYRHRTPDGRVCRLSDLSPHPPEPHVRVQGISPTQRVGGLPKGCSNSTRKEDQSFRGSRAVAFSFAGS